MNEKILMQAGIGVLVLGVFYFAFAHSNLEYTQVSKVEQKANEFIEAPDKLKATEGILLETNQELQRVTQDLEVKQRFLEIANQKLQQVAVVNQKVEDLVSQAQNIGDFSDSIDEITSSLEEQRKSIREFLEKKNSFWGRVGMAWKTIWGGFSEADEKFQAFNERLNELKGVLVETRGKIEDFKEVSEEIRLDIQNLQEGVNYEN